jgi:alpha-beta hydrolase superfamily lysophospholipase
MCKIKSDFYSNRQGIRLFTEQWIPTGKPLKGLVQIAHGMRESTGYYREFCGALTKAGYGVLTHDARGHGQTAGAQRSEEFRKNAGEIGENGIGQMVDDLAELTDWISKQNPGVPVYLLGHSMGSVLARLYVSQYGDKLGGLIYSGTTGPADPVEIAALLNVAEEETKKLGRHAAAAETPKQLFGHFNDRIHPVKTGYEYMSRDEEMVRQAIESPYAAIAYRCGFYIDFIRAMQVMDRHEKIDLIPKKLPILSVSGDMDPFGDYGKGIKELFSLYHLHGIENTSFTLYKGGRHEMLREINRREVFADIIRWLDANGK